MDQFDPVSAFYTIGDQLREEQPHEPPSILSASTYTRRSNSDNSYNRQRSSRTSETAEPQSVEDTGDEKPRWKRVKRSEEDDEDSKKQRGRPRLDPQDETAADRRRTQIRLAQRAYRLRKETTISGLKKRVSQVEETIDQMNKTFLAFNDNMLSSGLLASKPSLAQQLKNTTARFLLLAQEATPDSDHEEEDAIAELTRRAEESISPKAPDNAPKIGYTSGEEQKSVPTTWDPSVAFQIPPDIFSLSDIDMQDFHNSQSTTLQPYNPPFPTFAQSRRTSSKSQSQTQFRQSQQTTYQQYNLTMTPPSDLLSLVKIPTTKPNPPTLGPTAPYTYSFQEPLFSRRLHRATLERGFRLLTSKNEPEIQRAFRFTFCFSNRERMIPRIRDVLKRSAGESLENWNIPFVSLGGAGTRFPKRDGAGVVGVGDVIEVGKVIGRSSRLRIGGATSVSSSEFSDIGFPEREVAFDSVEELIRMLGCEGVYFDSFEVEEYLKEKGLVLDGSSSYVDVNPAVVGAFRASPEEMVRDDSSFGDGEGREAVSPISPILDVMPYGAETFNGEMDPDYNTSGPKVLSGWLFDLPQDGSTSMSPQEQSLYLDNNPFPYDFWGSKTSNPSTATKATPSIQTNSQPFDWTTVQNSASTPPALFPPQPQQQSYNSEIPYMFDVDKFLDTLINSAICLGRAPGFRKTDVDNAVFAAVQEVY